MPKQIIVPAVPERTRYRIISNIYYNVNTSIVVNMTIADLVDGQFVIDNTVMNIGLTIIGEAYTELLSASPVWNPNKDLNYYNEDDLWYIIDEIESGNLSNSEEVASVMDNKLAEILNRNIGNNLTLELANGLFSSITQIIKESQEAADKDSDKQE